MVTLMPMTAKTSLTDENYAVVAEFIMKGLSTQPDAEKLTTSKLRSIYALVMNVYSKIDDGTSFASHKGDIQYLKVRMAYEAGREKAVKVFLDKTKLMEGLNNVTSYEQFMLFCRYAESLVAYYKFFGGKDQ